MIICPRELRIYVRGIVGSRVAWGRIPNVKSFSCVDCGEPATRYDHRNYTKPLKIDPVCNLCDNKRGQGKPDINGPCVELKWKSKKVPSKCGECHCPTFGRVSGKIKDGIDMRKKVWQ